MTIDDDTAVTPETAHAQPDPDSHLLPGEKVDLGKPRKARKPATKKDKVPTAKGPKLPKTVKKAPGKARVKASVAGGTRSNVPAAKPAKAKAKREREPRAARGLTNKQRRQRDRENPLGTLFRPAKRNPIRPPASASPKEKIRAPHIGRRGRAPLWPTDIAKLQALYYAEVGRPITSTSRRYLIMQLRRTRAGNPPTGRVGRKLGENPKVIPLRFPSEAVEALDAFLDGKMTRAEFFTRAACAALKKAGENTVAAHFA